MCISQKFYFCKHCGNLIGLVLNKGVPLVCCGEQMEALEPNSVEASQEKHIPQVKIEGNNIFVTIGSIEHPMTAEHYISFIYLETENGGQRKCVKGLPKAEFSIINDKPIAVYAYCNLHGLWKYKI